MLCTSFATVALPIGPIGRAVAHRVEHGLVLVKGLPVAADPDRHLARRRTRRTAADGSIEHVRALGGKGLVNFFHSALRICRQVKIGRAAFDAFDQAVGAQRHAFDVDGLRQRGEDHVGLFGKRARRIRPFGACLQMMARRLPVQIMHHELVTGLENVGGHLATHGAEPNEPDHDFTGHCHSLVVARCSCCHR